MESVSEYPGQTSWPHVLIGVRRVLNSSEVVCLLEFVIDLHPHRARLVGRVAHQLRDVELEAGVVRRHEDI